MKRKGSSEVISIVLIIVIAAVLGFAVGCIFSNKTSPSLAVEDSLYEQTISSLNAGMTQQTKQLGTNYTDATTQKMP